jgi:hypothetical protein
LLLIIDGIKACRLLFVFDKVLINPDGQRCLLDLPLLPGLGKLV